MRLLSVQQWLCIPSGYFMEFAEFAAHSRKDSIVHREMDVHGTKALSTASRNENLIGDRIATNNDSLLDLSLV